jgi:hypothetical protein
MTVGRPQIVDREADVQVANIRSRPSAGTTLRFDVLDQVDVEPRNIEPHDFQTGTRNADESRHIFGCHLAALVRHVETQ